VTTLSSKRSRNSPPTARVQTQALVSASFNAVPREAR
jgi:hypothetical protein